MGVAPATPFPCAFFFERTTGYPADFEEKTASERKQLHNPVQHKILQGGEIERQHLTSSLERVVRHLSRSPQRRHCREASTPCASVPSLSVLRRSAVSAQQSRRLHRRSLIRHFVKSPEYVFPMESKLHPTSPAKGTICRSTVLF